MKILLLFAFFSLTFLHVNAQCIANASDFGNNINPDYEVFGDFNVVLNTNETVTINFGSNYSTASGPDVRLYLIKSEGRTKQQLQGLNPTTLENIAFGKVGFSGAQSYTQAIPNNVDITAYDTVFFFCLQFRQFWDFGSYTPFSSNNCTVLSTNSFALENIKAYPNPAINTLHISNPTNINASIAIFNILGKQVLQSKITTASIDISNFNSGIYMLRIDANGKTKTQRLVIQ